MKNLDVFIHSYGRLLDPKVIDKRDDSAKNTRMRLVYQIDLQLAIFVGKRFELLMYWLVNSNGVSDIFMLACMNSSLLTSLEFFQNNELFI